MKVFKAKPAPTPRIPKAWRLQAGIIKDIAKIASKEKMSESELIELMVIERKNNNGIK